jgi:hypothetical protein
VSPRLRVKVTLSGFPALSTTDPVRGIELRVFLRASPSKSLSRVSQVNPKSALLASAVALGMR